jgi:hypothetical protein
LFSTVFPNTFIASFQVKEFLQHGQLAFKSRVGLKGHKQIIDVNEKHSNRIPPLVPGKEETMLKPRLIPTKAPKNASSSAYARPASFVPQRPLAL